MDGEITEEAIQFAAECGIQLSAGLEEAWSHASTMDEFRQIVVKVKAFTDQVVVHYERKVKNEDHP